jgi:CRP-like cAMP-binding protein
MIRRLSAVHPHTIDLPMSRQDIADHLCLTIETVCRSLSELRRAHVIDIPSRHRIVIKDVNSLETMTTGEE